jgi:hypothetical protein
MYMNIVVTAENGIKIILQRHLALRYPAVFGYVLERRVTVSFLERHNSARYFRLFRRHIVGCAFCYCCCSSQEGMLFKTPLLDPDKAIAG